MKIKIKQLRKIIKEEAARLNEGPTGSVTLSDDFSFNEFRTLVADAMQRAGAPADLVDEMGDLSVSSPGASALHHAWEESSYEWKAVKSQGLSPEEERFELFNTISGFMPDAMFDIVDAYQNGMNYPPGHRPEHIDPQELGKRVQDVMNQYADEYAHSTQRV